MRPGLRYFNIALISFCVFWIGILTALWLGFYAWPTFAVSGAVALAIGIPAGLWVTQAIKRGDPNWPPRLRRRQKA